MTLHVSAVCLVCSGGSDAAPAPAPAEVSPGSSLRRLPGWERQRLGRVRLSGLASTLDNRARPDGPPTALRPSVTASRATGTAGGREQGSRAGERLAP